MPIALGSHLTARAPAAAALVQPRERVGAVRMHGDAGLDVVVLPREARARARWACGRASRRVLRHPPRSRANRRPEAGAAPSGSPRGAGRAVAPDTAHRHVLKITHTGRGGKVDLELEPLPGMEVASASPGFTAAPVPSDPPPCRARPGARMRIPDLRAIDVGEGSPHHRLGLRRIDRTPVAPDRGTASAGGTSDPARRRPPHHPAG